MKAHDKESQIYVLNHNNQIYIRNNNDDTELYYFQSNEYVETIANDINLRYSKIPIDKNNSKIYINDINDQIDNVHNKIIEIKSNNKQTDLNQISQINDKITNANKGLKYLNKFSNKLNIGNVKDANLIITEFNAFINFTANDFANISQILNTLSETITQLVRINNCIINFFNILKVAQYKIFELINDSTILMNNFLNKQKESKIDIKSLDIQSILIDQNQRPILVFDGENSSISEKSDLEMLKKAKNIFENILTQFCETEERFYEKIKIGEGESDGVEEYFINEIKKFKNDLSKIINKKQSITDLITDLTKFSKKFDTLIKENPNEIYTNQSSHNNNWYYLLGVAKYHIPFNSSTILSSINSIFNLYFQNVGNPALKKTYDEFIQLFSEYETNNKTNLNVIQEIIDKEVQQQGNYFYLEILFHIALKNLLDEKLFKEQYIKAIGANNYDCEEDNDPDNKYKLIKDSALGTEITTSKFCYTSNFNFILELDYKTDIDEAQINLRNNEIKIFGAKYSKFIVPLIENINNNNTRIIIPYFSSRTLDKIIHCSSIQNKSRIKLTLVDKIVIILEIATALMDLHSNGICHGNLSSQAIYINSKNDAYLGGFSYYRNIENQQTKPVGPFYYHSPEYFQNRDIDFDMGKLIDVYSFGVLIHEVFTEVKLDARFGNMNRDLRMQKLTKMYFEYLITGEQNDYFTDDAYLIDQNGNCLIGMKEIIEKCMKIDSSERFSSFGEIIDVIKSLSIYEANKIEIEYRIENAYDSSNFQCSVFNLVESFFRGQHDCETDIENVLNKYCDITSKNKIIIDPNDIIKNIFDVFDIKADEDFTYIFEDIFDYIIQSNFLSKINEINDFTDGMFNLSNVVNARQSLEEHERYDKNEQICKLIIPISSLSNFIKNNENAIGNLKPTWAYLIARELLYIHSKNLYHGSISLDNIGIYYNHKTQTFVPSIILYYITIKRKNQKEQRSVSKEELIKKNQKKDLEKLIEILKKFDIKDEIIDNQESIKQIVINLYNFITNECSQVQSQIFTKNFDLNNYSQFQMTYSTYTKFFSPIESTYSFEGLFLDFEKSLQIIIQFLDNISKDFTKTVIESIPLSECLNIDESLDIPKLINTIKVKCSFVWNLLLSKISSMESEIQETVEKEDDFIKFDSFGLIPRDKTPKKKKWFDKPVDRKFEITELYFRSVEFLIRRYIFALNPQLDFKVAIKISNKDYSKYQDTQFKYEDIKSIASKIGFTEVVNDKGCVVITVNLRSKNMTQKPDTH